mmetsp:Transcript_12270/g.19749  ORF Transcript_12270/g.19749 Transcript_12270/m.19749 type:complete len:90 (-) Transcript_12270:145-414(-)
MPVFVKNGTQWRFQAFDNLSVGACKHQLFTVHSSITPLSTTKQKHKTGAISTWATLISMTQFMIFNWGKILYAASMSKSPCRTKTLFSF